MDSAREVVARAMFRGERPDDADEDAWDDYWGVVGSAWLDRADAALTAIAKAGLVVVPVTPTETMLEAGANRWDTHDPGAGINYANERATWAAMLAAAGAKEGA